MFEGDSFNDLTFTFHQSKLTCWKPMYFAHVTFAYLTIFAGIGCFITRLSPRITYLHAWFGRLYIIFMLWATATSLLIHNTGLPVAVLASFLWVLLGLSVGWLVIIVHKMRYKPSDFASISAWRETLKKMISLKSLHGCLMFISWINLAGRMFATPRLGDFDCYTYAAYKPVTNFHYNGSETSEIKLVPAQDPNYYKQPWAYHEDLWMSSLLVFPALFAFAFGLIFVYIQQRRLYKRIILE